MRHAPPYLVTGLCRPGLYSPSRFWASERLTCWAKRRHVWGVTRSTGPVRSLLSDGDQVLVLADFDALATVSTGVT